MYKIDIRRQPSDNKQTLGEFTLSVNDDVYLIGKSLELPWLDNQHGISCIPTGEYNLEPWDSDKFGHCLHIKDVPNRDCILIHAGNYNRDTHGCILLGKSFSDIDKDGYLDIISSKLTLNAVMSLIEGKEFGGGVLTIA